MHNPFLAEGVLRTNASINKLMIIKMPLCSSTQDISGKAAQEIFSTDLFIKEIKKSADKLQIKNIESLQEKSLPLYLESCLASDNTLIQEAAGEILRVFGERLAVILLCLKEGAAENRAARTDWTDAHWNYWSSLGQVILVGGLASPPLGEQLKYYVEQVFAASGKHPYSLILGKDSAYAGIRGCTAYLGDNHASQANLIFDYGQSFIKRSYVIMEKQRIKEIKILDRTLSQHVEWDIKDPYIEKQEAQALNNHFLKTIARTIDETEARGMNIHPHIILSIANYVRNGVISNRGGYGKLRLIASDYASYLSARMKEISGRDFYFSLVHDGTAMAAGYADYENAVCISLGTAFGVGFPVKNVIKKEPGY